VTVPATSSGSSARRNWRAGAARREPLKNWNRRKKALDARMKKTLRQQAEPLYKRLLVAREKVLGPDRHQLRAAHEQNAFNLP
jgi:hypothetical protein